MVFVLFVVFVFVDHISSELLLKCSEKKRALNVSSSCHGTLLLHLHAELEHSMMSAANMMEIYGKTTVSMIDINLLN